MDERQSPLTVELIAQGLQPARKEIKVIFSGPEAPPNLHISATPEVSWGDVIRNMSLAIERLAEPLPENKPHG